MYRWFAALVFILVVLLSTPAFTAEATWNETIYLVRESCTVAWDVAENATSYEVKPVWVDSQGDKHQYASIPTTNTQLTVYRPRGGFFVFYARSLRSAPGEEDQESPWIASTNPEYATVNGQPKGWRVYFEIPPPASGGID